jgi:hypothetical protein
MFLKIALILIFQSEKLLSLNLSISYFAAILFIVIYSAITVSQICNVYRNSIVWIILH